MLKTVKVSANRKTGPIAVTYRAGVHETYATCPKSCALHPAGDNGADLIDEDYLQALRAAVPRNGQAWTYSHFPAQLLPVPKAGETVINVSCDNMLDAVQAMDSGRPAVVAAPAGTEWAGGVEYRGRKFIQCPAELSESFTCAQCGGGRPLCAQGNRDFVIVFVAHGPSAAKVGKAIPGGCYAAGGPVAIAWHGTRKAGRSDDARALLEFSRALPPGSFLRHHVAGDIGRAV